MKTLKVAFIALAIAGSSLFTACASQETPKSAETPKPVETDKPAQTAKPNESAAGGDLAKGKELFKATGCEVCHKADGTGGIANARNFTDAAWQSKETDTELANSIKNGVQGTSMAAYKDRVKDDDVKALVAYIRSFKK